ncbi:MAG: hypothetical protein HQL70_04085 [Magnetococcales bacterium]|nr:hypothetical protein [Magnetococcales bacterium]
MGYFKSIKGRDRPLSCVPLAVYILLAVALSGQMFFHSMQPRPVALADDLPNPPKIDLLNVVSLGEPVTLAKVLMLWLQAFDYQSGISIRFMDLDPVRLSGWLEKILELDQKSHYPLIAASHMYADIPREDTQRIMSEFVLTEFLKDPNRRWRSLGNIAILAKHRLNDLPLALRYAKALADNATGANVPGWAKQMQFHFLEDMGEIEAARLFIRGLLASGKVTLPEEINFLNENLERLEQVADKR